MLAQPADDLDAALARVSPAGVEEKLDGVRIQVHRAGDDVRIFTRNLNDITARLPEVVDLVRAMSVNDVVLDGEAIGVSEDARPHRFQDTMRRFGADTIAAERALRAWFFDVLRVDGSDLLQTPLRERLDVLARVAEDHRIPAVATDDPAVAAAVLDEALATGHEGVMVKSLDSAYDAGRRGGAWRKVKPVRTLELVVLAVEWGHGRRRGWLSNLHLGARDRDDWTVYLRPELVVEIELDGAQVSTRYPGGVALRFARVVRYRPDKEPADADTIDTVRSLLGHAAE
jgi:DNA ligase-1